MIPVALLGSAVYMVRMRILIIVIVFQLCGNLQGLQLLQTHLSHEKYLDEARARVEELERDIDALVRERRNTPPSYEGATNAAVLDATTTGGWFGWLRRR
jgi:hypothetical protein